MYTLEIKLDSRGYETALEKRFWLLYKLKRATIQWFNTQEHRRVTSEAYLELAQTFKEYKESCDTLNKEERKLRDKEFIKLWSDLNKSFKLDSGKFVKYTDLGQASNMFQRYASEGYVNWSSFEGIAVDVKAGYLKRRSQSDSVNYMKIPPYRTFNGFIVRKRNMNVSQEGIYLGGYRGAEKEKGIFLPFDFSANKGKDIALAYALSEQKMSYWGIYRKFDKHGKAHYFAQIIFDGQPYNVNRITGKGKVTLSVDVDKLALVAENGDQRLEFDLGKYSYVADELSRLDRKIENSRRLNNPQNFNPDGTIKAGTRLVWNNSKNYYKLLGRKRYIWHKVTQTRKNFYGFIANALLSMGDEFEIHKQDFKSLQERIKYNKETMSWNQSRRSRGAEIMFNAPNEFITILNTKLAYNGVSPVIVVKK